MCKKKQADKREVIKWKEWIRERKDERWREAVMGR